LRFLSHSERKLRSGSAEPSPAALIRTALKWVLVLYHKKERPSKRMVFLLVDDIGLELRFLSHSERKLRSGSAKPSPAALIRAALK